MGESSPAHVVILDYGMGNLGSIANMVRHLGFEPRVADQPEAIADAPRLILPGVGHFARGMEGLQRRGLVPALTDAALRRRIPVLGICLGMQLMGSGSEEGEGAGLGWLPMRFVRFRPEDAGGGIKVPCMGWNEVTIRRPSALFHGLEDPRFYFVHSYHARTEVDDLVVAEAHYGYAYPAACVLDNLGAVQFHPEKSHRHGLALLRNFLTH